MKESPQQPPTNTSSKYTVEINGKPWEACPGQTVAAALVAAGVRTLRHTPNDAPRGLFCGMGVCYECLVTINGVPDQRACMTLVEPDMKIEATSNGQ